MTTATTFLSHSEIIQKVPVAFDIAYESGDLFYFPSTVVRHEEIGIEFEIKLCPALQQKPALPTPHFDSVETDVGTQANKKFDPFSPPYNPQLYIGDIQDGDTKEVYAILLNKYSATPHHFLMVTKEFSSQATPLTPPELVQAYSLLSAARRAGKEFFAFYNCGDNSGASQPHKHVQFIPIESAGGPPIERLAREAKIEFQGKPFSLSLPYASHTFRFPPHLSASSTSSEELEMTLATAFMQLLDLCISSIRRDPDYPTGKPSFNVVLTLDHLHLIPRKQENYKLVNGDDISVNSLGFAGCLLVKSEEELAVVKEESIGKILRGVGIENVHDELAKTCTTVESHL